MNRMRLAFSLIALLAAGNTYADKPSWAGHPHQQGSQETSVTVSSGNVRLHFDERQRTAVHTYYSSRFQAGKCPRGLAKKHNGCLPPGQAKKWAIGQPLPHDVERYDLPASVTVKLGTPPEGHRYVRVAADILLIAVGTAMVVDAIEDIGKM